MSSSLFLEYFPLFTDCTGFSRFPHRSLLPSPSFDAMDLLARFGFFDLFDVSLPPSPSNSLLAWCPLTPFGCTVRLPTIPLPPFWSQELTFFSSLVRVSHVLSLTVAQREGPGKGLVSRASQAEPVFTPPSERLAPYVDF